MKTANFGMRTVTVITAMTALSWALPALAVAPLEGRTITGDRVDAYDASAVMIYDPNADLTWLRDWNVNGAKPWVDQLIWVSNLQVGKFANWSLPTARNPDGSDCGGFCPSSQMGYLWFEVLGNTFWPDVSFDPPPPFVGPFQNVAHPDGYWSGTQIAAFPGFAWVFGTLGGNQGSARLDDALYAVAVRPGDVAAPIPEPQTWAMLMMGLGVVTVALRRRSR